MRDAYTARQLPGGAPGGGTVRLSAAWRRDNPVSEDVCCLEARLTSDDQRDTAVQPQNQEIAGIAVDEGRRSERRSRRRCGCLLNSQVQRAEPRTVPAAAP